MVHLDLDGSELRFAPVRLDEVILSVANRLEMDADLKEIELDYQMPAMPVFVQGDAMLLARVFQNVVLNTIENTPRLGLVGIEIESLEDRVRVVISDTGPGIPAQIRRSLSDPKFRPKAMDDMRPNGRGLGLIFVRQILEPCAGNISIEPRRDEEGNTFICRSPL